ncbi:hypothetical protein B9Z19DRAFT_1154150 [Tuber borchii]|uniref:Uncharacterized protein n=1 Tax=Tuber borchii TaxID=42251 RepID=A0A2T6ZIM9_TUBBO|nr:hypothetical protein B9Z19DRAFT_1154150 [Tuber borchii]
MNYTSLRRSSRESPSIPHRPPPFRKLPLALFAPAVDGGHPRVSAICRPLPYLPAK